MRTILLTSSLGAASATLENQYVGSMAFHTAATEIAPTYEIHQSDSICKAKNVPVNRHPILQLWGCYRQAKAGGDIPVGYDSEVDTGYDVDSVCLSTILCDTLGLGDHYNYEDC